MTKLKGNKVYAVITKDDHEICFVAYKEKDNAISEMKEIKPYLVELTITRVFTRERDLKEIETEL